MSAAPCKTCAAARALLPTSFAARLASYEARRAALREAKRQGKYRVKTGEKQ